MIIVEALLIAVLICTCIYASITDIKSGIIPNKLLLISGAVCLVLNVVYYAFFAQQYFITFIVNFAILVTLSILMYAFNLWAAGDSKLLFLIVFAIPSRYYFTEMAIGLAPAIFVIVFTFSISFIYVVCESIIFRIKNRDKIKLKISKNGILNYLKNYLYCTVYIVMLNYLIMLLFPQFAATNASLITIFNLFITIIIYKYEFFFKPIALIGTSIIAIAAVVVNGLFNGFYPPDFKVYLYLAIILYFRNISEKFNYDTIPTSTVKKGMILANSTVAMMLPSRIKGLPEYSTEDMRSRLTEEQVESIHRWETSRYGLCEVTIVRKIPFAIFMAIGSIIFLVIRMGVI